MTQSGGGMLAAPSQVKVVKPDKDDIPQVGEAAPPVETDTIASAKGDEESIDTRIPTAPELHQESFADVVGKKPVALLFATPQLCQSRVCGPVTDIALQMKAKYGDKMTFIHQEVYRTTTPTRGCASRCSSSTSSPSRGCSSSAPTARSRSGSRARSG